MSDLYDPAFPTGMRSLQESKASVCRQEFLMKRDYCSKLNGIGLGQYVTLNQIECKTPLRDEEDEPPESVIGNSDAGETVNALKTEEIVISEQPRAKTNELQQYENIDLRNVLMKFASTHLGMGVKHCNGVLNSFSGYSGDSVLNCSLKTNSLLELGDKNIPVTRDHSYSRTVLSPSAVPSATLSPSVGEKEDSLVVAKSDEIGRESAIDISPALFLENNTIQTCLLDCGAKSVQHTDAEAVSEERVLNDVCPRDESNDVKSPVPAGSCMTLDDLNESKTEDCAPVQYSLLDIPLPEDPQPSPCKNDSVEDKVLCLKEFPVKESSLPQEKEKWKPVDDVKKLNNKPRGAAGFLDIPLPDSPMPNSILSSPRAKDIVVKDSNKEKLFQPKSKVMFELRLPKFRRFLTGGLPDVLSQSPTRKTELSRPPIVVKEESNACDIREKFQRAILMELGKAKSATDFSLQDIPLPNVSESGPLLCSEAKVKEQSKVDMFEESFSEFGSSVSNEATESQKNLQNASDLTVDVAACGKSLYDFALFPSETPSHETASGDVPLFTKTSANGPTVSLNERTEQLTMNGERVMGETTDGKSIREEIINCGFVTECSTIVPMSDTVEVKPSLPALISDSKSDFKHYASETEGKSIEKMEMGELSSDVTKTPEIYSANTMLFSAGAKVTVDATKSVVAEEQVLSLLNESTENNVDKVHLIDSTAELSEMKDKMVEDVEKECESPQDNAAKKRNRKGNRSVGSDSSCSSPIDEQPVRRSSRIRSLEEKKGKVRETPKKEDGKKNGKTTKQESSLKEASEEKIDVLKELETSSNGEVSDVVHPDFRESVNECTDLAKKSDVDPSFYSESSGQENALDGSVLFLPSADLKREDEVTLRPEKVKSRWRRNSELERVTATPQVPQHHFEVVGCGASQMDLSKENAICEAIPVAVTPPDIPAASPIPEPSPDVEASPEKMPDFEFITENIYLFERKRSKSKKEVRRMVCDCTFTKEEKELGLFGCGEDCLNRLLMIECGSRCPLGDNCGNKRFQKKQSANVEPFKTKKKGWGLRTGDDLPVGTFVMEYVGEVLSYPEFKQRVKQYAKGKSDHYYFMALKSDEIIDATSRGSYSRFINHSCSPNCETQKWTVNGELRIGFFTTEFVKAGEELTFDYQFQRYGREAQKCYCESKICRGFIGQENKITLKSSRTLQKKRRTIEEKKREALEDLALEEEIERLSSKGGLRNKETTLMFARLMVRAEDVQTRIQLLDIVEKTTEPACMRLFLDYHGLPLLWSWMVDVGDDAWELKMKILHVLSLLPITNKTMLLDSKVINVVQRWSQQVEEAGKALKEKDLEQSSCSPPSETMTPSNSGSIENLVTTVDESACKSGQNEVESDAAEANLVEEECAKEEVDTSSSVLIADMEESSNSSDPVGTTAADAATPVLAATGEESTSPCNGSRTDELSVKSDEESRDATDFVEKKELDVPNLASKLLELWSTLKEVFRIPRLEKQKRKEDEIAAGQQDVEQKRESENEWRDRYRDRKRGRHRDDGDRDYERRMSESRMKRLRSLLPQQPTMSKEERRQLFAMEVRQRDHEEAIRRQQEEIEMSFLEGQGDPALAAAILLEHEQQKQQQAMLEYLPAEMVMEYPTHAYAMDAVGYQVQEGVAYPSVDSLAYQVADPAAIPFVQPAASYDCAAEAQVYGPPLPVAAAVTYSNTVPPDAQIAVLPVAASPALAVSSPLEGQALRHPLGYVDVAASPVQHAAVIHQSFADPVQTASPVHVFKQPAGVIFQAPPPPQVACVQTPVPAEALPPTYTSPNPVVTSPSPIPPPALLSPSIVTSPQAPPTPVVSTATTVVAPSYVSAPQPYITQQGTQLYYLQNAVVPLSEQQAVSLHGNMPLVHMAVPQAPAIEDTTPVPSLAKSKPLKMPPFWKTAKDGEGNVYYYHSITRETQWDPPVCGNEETPDMDLGTPTFDEPKHSKKKTTTTAAADTSSELAKKIKELFRTKMSSYIVQCLNPYRKPDCKLGRITCTEDFKHLARKLTHFVMSKELKHCKNVEDLECNENVKHKAKEFVHKYMSRYGAVYKKDKGSPKSL